ncbi:GlxA family transcriptional regulator [Heliomarina baculiformis]|uniref:GlxA family transcriptional regulator n=1 Tax=Heliomarina baculiformis TaxID=2872036 RepID=UPI001EE25802|nr:GlxA family transcriptional regulator [Heliomarina baculiformis]
MKSAKNIFQPSRTPLRVAALVLSDCNTLSFAAAIDPMRAANRLGPGKSFDWHYVTATDSPATLTSGLQVPANPISRLESCDLLLVIAGFNLETHATPALIASLRRIAASGATLAGIDGGPWLMARAGLLDGYRATTHWEDLEDFAIRFPAITVLRDRFHIDRARMTSGGATPAIDMMLHLIGARCGETLASRVAGVFIYDSTADPARAQRRTGPRPRHSALTARASALMEDNLDTPLTIAAIARHTGTSPRALQAQFRTRLSTTPQAHYLHLRLTEALRLVTDTDMPLTAIALATGFASPASFSRAFHKAHGSAARRLRQKAKSPASLGS